MKKIILILIISLFVLTSCGSNRHVLTEKCSFGGNLNCDKSHEINSNGEVNFFLKSGFDKKININKVSIIEKSLDSSGVEACVAEPNTSISAYGEANLKLNFEGNCGIAENKGRTKSFIVRLEYAQEGSSIPLINTGEITTKVK